jgi:hypothetical protein
MNWLMLIGLVCLVIVAIQKLGLLLSGLIFIVVAGLIELW